MATKKDIVKDITTAINNYNKKYGNVVVDDNLTTIKIYQTPIDRTKTREQTIVRYKLKNKVIGSIVYRPTKKDYVFKLIGNGDVIVRANYVYYTLEDAKKDAKRYCEKYAEMRRKEFMKVLDEYTNELKIKLHQEVDKYIASLNKR